MDQGEFLFPVEIKAGRTITSDYFKRLEYFSKLAGDLQGRSFIVYGGDTSQTRTNAEVISWKSLAGFNFLS